MPMNLPFVKVRTNVEKENGHTFNMGGGGGPHLDLDFNLGGLFWG